LRKWLKTKIRRFLISGGSLTRFNDIDARRRGFTLWAVRTRFAVILLLLNAAALAAGYYYFSETSNRRVAAAGESAQQELAAWKAEAAQAQSAEPQVVYRTNGFNWSQIESSDYKEYIANLRAIGCPEATIRDIILTDVMHLYALRRGKYYHNGREFKFWETNEKRHLKQSQLEEREKALAEIDKELPSVLRQLLGINYEREVNKYFVDAEEDNSKLSFLNDDKRDKAMALREKFEGEREQALLTHADAATLEKIAQDQDAAFGDLLTSDEKQQYDLSMSPTADRLRQQLIGFNPTEDEFKALFAKEKAIDDMYDTQDQSDPATAQAKSAEEQAALDAFKGTLTPDRAAQLAESSDPDYQSLCELSERFDLPESTSGNLLDMRRVAEEEKRELLENKSIPPDRVADALKAIQAQTQQAAQQALGAQAYQQYSQSATWLQNLGNN
jgi:hypothetical protein